MTDRWNPAAARWEPAPRLATQAPALTASPAARALAPGRFGVRRDPRAERLVQRMYASARPSRLTADWATSTGSADSELSSSLTTLRNRSRSLIRDNAYAKRAKAVVVNNVIGTGIGLQAQVLNARGSLNRRMNTALEDAFCEWSRPKSCHTGGILHFADIERLLVGELFEAGEVLIRMHPRAFGPSRIPLAVEVIEAERLADEWTVTNPPADGGVMRMGIEVDRFDRPLYYWLRERHPGELRSIPGASQRLERVPAEQIIHVHLLDRWPQTRGIPWLCAVINRLRDIDGYSEAEIIAARAAACYMGFIKQTGDPMPGADMEAPAAPRERVFEPGMIDELGPGEEFQLAAPNRPNTGMDPFLRLMLREVAAGVGVSYEAISRDYSQSNYSSSRLSLIDDREVWRVLQGFFIRTVRAELHSAFIRQAALARAIPGLTIEDYAAAPERIERARFKPRGWAWVDPTKEVAAYKEAVRCGFTTTTDVIAATAGGQDIEDILETRAAELELMAEYGLAFDTDPAKPTAAPSAAATEPAAPAEPEEATEPEADEDAPPPRAPARALGAILSLAHRRSFMP